MRRSLLIACLLVAGCGGPEPEPSAEVSETTAAAAVPLLRVRVLANVSEAPILGGPFEVRGGDGLSRLELPTAGRIRRTDAGWQIGSKTLPALPDGSLVLRDEQPGSLTVGPSKAGRGGRTGRYRGRLRLVPKSGAKFDVVNEVDAESYVRGVVTSEMPADFGHDALAAQAVASRTYALYTARTRDRGHYDLMAGTGDQVYRGIAGESRNGDAAVAATRGVVLAYDPPGPDEPRIFKTYFHSTAGGATLGVADAYAEPPLPPLGPQDLGDLEDGTPHFAWDDVRVTKDDLTRRFQTWGRERGHALARIGRVERVEVVARTDHNRPSRFRVTDARGGSVDLLGEQLRWAVNTTRDDATKIDSSHTEPRTTGDAITFTTGRGWGHGVGMSQYAAKAMADRGADWRTILARSYPESAAVRAWE